MEPVLELHIPEPSEDIEERSCAESFRADLVLTLRHGAAPLILLLFEADDDSVRIDRYVLPHDFGLDRGTVDVGNGDDVLPLFYVRAGELADLIQEVDVIGDSLLTQAVLHSLLSLPPDMPVIPYAPE